MPRDVDDRLLEVAGTILTDENVPWQYSALADAEQDVNDEGVLAVCVLFRDLDGVETVRFYSRDDVPDDEEPPIVTMRDLLLEHVPESMMPPVAEA